VSPFLGESSCSPINILIINATCFSQECYTPTAAESAEGEHKSVLGEPSRGHALWWALGKWTFIWESDAVGMVAVADGNKGNLLDYREGYGTSLGHMVSCVYAYVELSNEFLSLSVPDQKFGMIHVVKIHADAPDVDYFCAGLSFEKWVKGNAAFCPTENYLTHIISRSHYLIVFRIFITPCHLMPCLVGLQYYHCEAAKIGDAQKENTAA